MGVLSACLSVLFTTCVPGVPGVQKRVRSSRIGLADSRGCLELNLCSLLKQTAKPPFQPRILSFLLNCFVGWDFSMPRSKYVLNAYLP